MPCPFRRLFCVGPRKEYSTSEVTRLSIQEEPGRKRGASCRERAGAQCAVGLSQREMEARSMYRGEARPAYRVAAVSCDEEWEPLLTGLSAEEARYIERELTLLLESSAL